MSEPIGTLRRARNVGAILLMQLVASCSAWRPLPGAGLAQPEGEPIGHARVFFRDGTEIEFRSGTIRPDSIVGYGDDRHIRLAIPRTEVARIDTRRTSVAATFLVGALASVALAYLGAR
jgi:hypothetical protein